MLRTEATSAASGIAIEFRCGLRNGGEGRRRFRQISSQCRDFTQSPSDPICVRQAWEDMLQEPFAQRHPSETAGMATRSPRANEGGPDVESLDLLTRLISMVTTSQSLPIMPSGRRIHPPRSFSRSSSLACGCSMSAAGRGPLLRSGTTRRAGRDDRHRSFPERDRNGKIPGSSQGSKVPDFRGREYP